MKKKTSGITVHFMVGFGPRDSEIPSEVWDAGGQIEKEFIPIPPFDRVDRTTKETIFSKPPNDRSYRVKSIHFARATGNLIIGGSDSSVTLSLPPLGEFKGAKLVLRFVERIE